MAVASPPRANRLSIDWDEVYFRFPEEMGALDEIVSSYESDQGISITPGALQVLFIPFVEGLEANEGLAFEELGPTIERIFGTLRKEPDERDEASSKRSSRSMLKAISKNWCGIPPICKRREGR